jgi:pyruvate dehydrogenase E2 component (dihydrolipoamide acetyltransferase)
MSVPIIIPDLGATGGDVVLAEWFVKEGDRVHEGQPLFAVETDKAVSNVEAFCHGYLEHILVAAGETVDIGATVATLTESSVATEMQRPPINAESNGPSHLELPDSSHSGAPTANRLHERLNSSTVFASPRARRVAAEIGVDLKYITGSGANGEIHERDVHRSAEQLGTSLAGARIAEVPQFCASIEIDVSDVVDLQKRIAETSDERGTQAVSVSDFILAATARALRKVPALNARLLGDGVEYLEDVEIGLAIATEQGIRIASLHEADRLTFSEVVSRSRHLIKQVTCPGLPEAAVSGGAITVFNPEIFALDQFTAVIQPSYAAALACGAVKARVVPRDGQLVIRAIMHATLSVHRQVDDGVAAATFLKLLKEQLESPYGLLMGLRSVLS